MAGLTQQGPPGSPCGRAHSHAPFWTPCSLLTIPQGQWSSASLDGWPSASGRMQSGAPLWPKSVGPTCLPGLERLPSLLGGKGGGEHGACAPLQPLGPHL